MPTTELAAGPALDAQIAEQVMRWKRRTAHIWEAADGTLWTTDAIAVDWAEVEAVNRRRYMDLLVFNPSTDLTVAWFVMEHQRTQGLGWGFRIFTPVDAQETWWAQFWSLVAGKWGDGKADTAPLAICRAVLDIPA